MYIPLPQRLRDKAALIRKMDAACNASGTFQNYKPSCDLMDEAAGEIERLQAIKSALEICQVSLAELKDPRRPNGSMAAWDKCAMAEIEARIALGLPAPASAQGAV